MSKKTAQIVFRLSPDLQAKISARAESERTSGAEVLRRAAKGYLEPSDLGNLFSEMEPRLCPHCLREEEVLMDRGGELFFAPHALTKGSKDECQGSWEILKVIGRKAR